MMSLTFSRVCSRTSGESLITRDTVFFDTLASRAMSLIVTLALSRGGRRTRNAGLSVFSLLTIFLGRGYVPDALALLSSTSKDRGAIVARSHWLGSKVRRVGFTAG